MGKAVAKRLTDRQIKIAMLDAFGKTSVEIAALLDCTPGYVRKTRQDPWFREERERWLSTGVVQLDPIIEALKVRALGVHREAMEELQEALHAEDADHNPLWDVRLKAIQIALNHRLVQAVVGAVDEGKSVVAAVTSISLNFFTDPKTGEPTLRPDWIEGDGSEIIDPTRKAFRIAQARINLANILDQTGGDTPGNADIATAEARLYDWLARRPEDIKVALREYFGAEHVP